jgi:hypothetical protein
MNAKRLKPLAKNHLTPDVRTGMAEMPDLSEYVEDFARHVDLEPLFAVTEEAIRRFPLDGGDAIAKIRSRSDSWLAPRVHAALRLSRRDAADTGLWFYLAAVPEITRAYTFYRWGGGRTDAIPIERFAGATSNQTFARLWWIAELTRNATDYSAAVGAMLLQDIPNTLLRLDAFHNRAFAIACVRYIERRKASSKLANRISKVLNSALVTRSLDAIATAISTADSVAVIEWLKEPPNVDQMLVDLPEGPDDYPVPEEEVAAVLTLIGELCDLLREPRDDGDDDATSDAHVEQLASV